MSDWKSAMRRGRDVSSDSLFFKLLLYGDSGAGKTWMGALSTADPSKVLGILTERNGEQSWRCANPDARYVLIPDGSEWEEVDEARTRLKEIYDDARSGVLAEMGIDTLVVDGLTNIQQVFKRWIMLSREDGEFSIRDWGTMHEALFRYCSGLRALPLDVVATALADVDKEDIEGGTSVRHIYPMFQGQRVHGQVMQFFNAVGFLYKGSAGRAGEATPRCCMFDGPSRYEVKGQHPLIGIVGGYPRDWLAAMRGAELPPTAQVGADAVAAADEAAAKVEADPKREQLKADEAKRAAPLPTPDEVDGAAPKGGTATRGRGGVRAKPTTTQTQTTKQETTKGA